MSWGPDPDFQALVFALLRAVGRADIVGQGDDAGSVAAERLGPAAVDFERDRDERRRAVATLLLGPMMREGFGSLGAVLTSLTPEEGQVLRDLMAGQSLWELFDLAGHDGAQDR